MLRLLHLILQENSERILHHTSKMVKLSPTCNLCGSNAFKKRSIYETRLKVEKEYEVLECVSCQLVFMHPQPADEVLNAVYKEYDSQYDFIAVTKDRMKNEYADRLSIAKKYGILDGKVLDVGSGVGGFLSIFKDHGYGVRGTEFSEDIIQLGKQAFGIQSEKLDLSEVQETAGFDIIHSHHVLEHVRDPKLYFHEVHRLLSNKGIFIFEVPNEFWSIVQAIRKIIGLPNQYPVYPSLHHLYFFKKKALMMYMRDVGFEVLEYKGYHKRHTTHPNRYYRALIKTALGLVAHFGYGTVHFFVCKKSG